MKTNLILLFMLLASPVFAQQKNLDKLPRKERDSILVKLANEAIEKYSIGYLRPGAKPYIQDVGYKLNETYKKSDSKEYMDRYHYVVSYLPTEKEKAFYKCGYLVKVTILADIGKVAGIRYIDDDGRYRFGLENASPDEKIFIRKFKTVEERLIEIKKINTPKVDTVLPPEMAEKQRKYLEKIKRRKDSLHVLRLQYLEKRDSTRKQDSIRMIRQQDSIKNVQTENK